MKTIQIKYYMDPICSACWSIEGIIRRLELEYGNDISIETCMGGLLPPEGWDIDSEDYLAPAELAELWDKSSADYNMPINGDVWLKSPLSSSYPASIAYRAAYCQSPYLADSLLRKLREKLFVESCDISSELFVFECAKEVGLDMSIFRKDFIGDGKVAFDKDIAQAVELGVELFPTLYVYPYGVLKSELVNVQHYKEYEYELLKLVPNLVKVKYDKSALSLLKTFGSLTSKELSILGDCSMDSATKELDDLVDNNLATVICSANGSLWKIVR